MAGYEIVVIASGVSALAAFLFAKPKKGGNNSNPKRVKKPKRQ